MSIPGAASPLFIGAAAGAAAAYQIDRSLRFDSGSSSYLSRTPSSAGNRRTFTWSSWVKRSSFGSQQGIFSSYAGAHPTTGLVFDAGNTFTFFNYNGSSYDFQLTSSAVFRDPSAWYHFVIAVDTTQATASNRIKIYVNGEQVTAFGTSTYPSSNFELDWNSTTEHNIGKHVNSLDGYLADVHFIDGQALAATDFGKYDTNNVWQPKAYSGTYGSNGFHLDFSDNSSNAALGYDAAGSNDWTVNNLNASVNYSGVSFDGSGDRLTVADDADLAFGTGEFTVEMYFIADTVTGNDVLYDSRAGTGNTTDGFSIVRNGNLLRTYTSGNYAVTSSTTLSTGQLYHLAVTREGTTQKMYLDGTLVGSATVNNNFSQQKATIGSDVNGDESWDGFISNVRLVKGTAVYTANFTVPTAPLTNVTNTVLLCCQSSTSVTAATVAPGTITAHGNVSVMLIGAEDIDSLIDTPTNYEAGSGNNGGNYATFNPLNHNTHSAYYTLSNGNLKCVAVGGSSKSSGSRGFCVSTLGMSSGKYYFELTVDLDDNNDHAVGIATAAGTGYYSTAGNWTYAASGNKFANSGSGASYGASYGNGDTIGVAFDADTGALVFYKNGTSQGTLATVTAGETYFFVWGTDAGTAQDYEVTANFGQRPFAYTPPTGHLALVTTNLSDPTIADGSTAMDAKLYTGNGSTQTISGLGFSPDLVWLKVRNTTYSHYLSDTVRGATKELYTNATNAEGTDANGLTAFTSDGFTLGTDVGRNESAKTYVGWAWDGGASTVSNTDGSITSSVRANASAGFSIISVPSINSTNTIRTAGHGLNAEPYFIISKNRDFADNWFCYHKDVQTNNRQQLRLNTTDATVTSGSDLWAHTSSVIGFNGALYVASGNTDDLIFFCWAPVEGYSAFGSYTGNGSADGPFVYTGFRPRFLLLKRTDGIKSWQVIDTERSAHNVTDDRLFPDDSGIESSSSNFNLDILSNGFKCRTAHDSTNVSGGTYIYAAFAEHPFKTARAR